VLNLSDATPAAALDTSGLTSIAGPFPTPREAFAAAAAIVESVYDGPRRPPLEVIGDFVIPPAGGVPSRDFQTLHLDFGLPLTPAAVCDVGRYTALHIPVDSAWSDARTRLVRLDVLLAQRTWPDHEELLRRFAAYGESHGAWEEADGYVEGSLARIVEAAAGEAPALPRAKANPDFLCGSEFPNLAAELNFFAAHGLSVQDVQLEVTLQPGALTVFDNLVHAHGRRGVRRPGELCQRVFGYRALSPSGQRHVRDRVLLAFSN
jgi:hypothetical protein